jgi:hypothetical protein
MSPALPLIAFAALATFLLPACAKAKYETPSYTVVGPAGTFEVRDYPQLTVVNAPMSKRGADGSFMKLFRFISGGNGRSEKIAMTTPVIMSGTESGTMSFVMPSKLTPQNVPAPSEQGLTVGTRPAGLYAVYRFSGTGSPAKSTEAAAKLLGWVSSKGLVPSGVPSFAYYNPPWTPWFMRRNEVMIPLSSASRP